MKVRHVIVGVVALFALGAPGTTTADTPLRANGRIAFSEATGIVPGI